MDLEPMWRCHHCVLGNRVCPPSLDHQGCVKNSWCNHQLLALQEQFLGQRKLRMDLVFLTSWGEADLKAATINMTQKWDTGKNWTLNLQLWVISPFQLGLLTLSFHWILFLRLKSWENSLHLSLFRGQSNHPAPTSSLKGNTELR